MTTPPPTPPAPRRKAPSRATKAAARLSTPPRDTTVSDRLSGELKAALDTAEAGRDKSNDLAANPPKRGPRAKSRVSQKASARQTPAPVKVEKEPLVLEVVRAMRGGLKSPKVSDADLVKICDAMIVRSTRSGTDSTMGQLSRHAGLELVAKIGEAVKPAAKK